LTFFDTGLPSAERREKFFLTEKKDCNPNFLCYIAPYTSRLYYPRIRINSEGKE